MCTEGLADMEAVRPPRFCGVQKPRIARMGRLCRAACAGVLTCSMGIVMSVVTSSPAFAGGPAISGTGSSYAALAINQWNAEVASEYQDTVNYSTTSSVIGLNDFAQYPQVDFGASEIGYSTNQANNNPPASFQYQYLPDIAGATCLDYNLNNQLGQRITDLNLNSSVLVAIFTGTITSWNAPAIQALNPGVLLPNSPIIMVYRTDASGDNFIFSDYLDTLQQAAWNAFTSATQSPAGPAAIWPTAPSGARTIGPYNFSNWTGENGSDNASNYVYGNEGTITYVETGYALLHNDPCASVTNSSGANVKPSEAADAIALQNDQLQADLEQNLEPVFASPQAGAYPISAYSYLIMAEQSGNSRRLNSRSKPSTSSSLRARGRKPPASWATHPCRRTLWLLTSAQCSASQGPPFRPQRRPTAPIPTSPGRSTRRHRR